MKWIATSLLMFVAAFFARGQDGDVSIIFDQEPQLRGMSFERQAMKPATTKDKGQDVSVWLAQQGSAPAIPWGRSVRLTITDPRFKNGAMPSAEVEIIYRNNANAPWEILADTARQSTRIGGGYGKDDGLKTVRIQLDDAFFGNRSFGNPADKSQTDGYDLRINAYNDDFAIRSVRVTGFDLTNHPDFARLLKLQSITTEPDDIFLFGPEQKAVLNFGLLNPARKPFAGRISFTVKDENGKMIAESKSPVTLKPADRTVVPYTFATAGLQQGIYYLDFQLSAQDAQDLKPILQERISLGVGSGAKIGKARPGEFLYGLDMRLGGAYHNPMLLRWATEMGADIIRHGFDAEDNFEEVAASLPLYEKLGLQVMFICGAPWNENADEREKSIAHRERFLEKLAGSFRQIHFYELGNEPDLKFFYGGPMASYTSDYQRLFAAVKRGNPDSVVTNGGLSFFADGDARSREFIKLVSLDKIDAFAYHGHGPGVEAERNALVRIRKATAAEGKSGKPFIETESGMAAKTLSQQREQARTVIEKMVFAQSENEPLFMWFRLLMFEEDYGSLNSEREPRPAALAYRTVVETLRGYRFSQLIDTGKEGVEAYLFTQNDGPGRVCVLWSNQPTFQTAWLALGASSAEVGNARLIDLFGNAHPSEVRSDGVVAAAVTEDPVFLKWETANAGFVARSVPSLLDLPPSAQLVLNSSNPLQIQVRNPYDHELKVSLDAKIAAGLSATISPNRVSLALAPKENKTVALSVRLDQAAQTFVWPEDWTVFANLDEKTLDLASLTSTPATVVGADGKAVTGTRVFPKNNLIDFTQFGGFVKERAAALAVAEITSEKDQSIQVGTGADWWMQWVVNGKPVFDTLEKGNLGATSIAAHTFQLPLRKGRNFVAVKILSGSGGWKFAAAGPETLRQAATTRAEVDHIDLTLSSEGKTLAAEKMAIQYTQPIPDMAGIALDDPIAKWEQRKPTAMLDEQSLRNLYDKAPDSSRWWHGPGDLSGRVWMTCDPRRIYYVVKVVDDVSVPGATADFDSLQLAVSSGDTTHEYLVGQKEGRVVIQKVGEAGLPAGEVPAGNREITAQIQRLEQPPDGMAATIYRISLDRKIAGEVFQTNLLVNDRDADVRKQYVAWRPGFEKVREPKLWYRATLER